MAKLMEQGPVLILAFQAQQLTRKKALDESGVADVSLYVCLKTLSELVSLPLQEILENVMYIWALCRDQSIYDPRTAWRVLEFGIQSAGKMLV